MVLRIETTKLTILNLRSYLTITMLDNPLFNKSVEMSKKLL